MKTPLLLLAIDFFYEKVLKHIRLALFPFKAITILISWMQKALWMLSNEYSKLSFSHCGSGVRIHGRFYCSSPENLDVGDNVHINTNAFFRAEGGLSIGSNTHISRNLVVYTMNHNYQGDLLPYDAGRILKRVNIGKNVWIGMNVMITPGVTVGDGAIIGMGAIVSKDVPPLAIIGSVHQRILKERDEQHYYQLLSDEKYSGMSGHEVFSRALNNR